MEHPKTMESHHPPGAIRPEPGATLIVIHDFSARSSDELSLSKGDRVELIERDDEFGDGWYLGRSLVNGCSGLFPEVYTRLAPRGSPSHPNLSTVAMSQTGALQIPSSHQSLSQSTAQRPSGETTTTLRGTSEPILDNLSTSQPSSLVASVEPPTNAAAKTIPPLSAVSVSSAAKSHAHGQDSPVMNETLSVIDEHITDMNHIVGSVPKSINDSGSEYSSHHPDARLSYINGEETDEEEEEEVHTLEEVTIWTPEQVAEYLFTVGVEKKHCEVFRDQEISGDVLLNMDQTSVFLKEFELGSVGRRLKTWQKIKALQDEVNGETLTRRNTATYGSEIGSEDGGRRSRSGTSSTMPPKTLSLSNRPGSSSNNIRQSQRTYRQGSLTNSSPISFKTPQGSPRAPDEKRPSAASIRDLHHSRQSSIGEFSTTNSLMAAVAGDQRQGTPTHRKQASFNKDWSLGDAISAISQRPLSSNRPLSSAGPTEITTADQAPEIRPPKTNLETDRGYFSGGELDGRQRNVLRKRGSTASHSRKSSYTDEQRLRTATTNSRHSRFGSVDSVREGVPPTAAQKYYGLSVNGRRRTPSESSINSPPRPVPPPKDDFPLVTRLQPEKSMDSIISPKSPKSPKSPSLRQGHPSDWLLPVRPAGSSNHFSMRAISDAVTGREKSRITSPTETVSSSTKESPLQSPSRTGSSTPSGGPSFELDPPDDKMAMVTPKTSRKKSKKETSAYTRGLEKKTPQEQMVGADYSGWMKKKSSNLMTTWKPRLFVLKGRRLSYYYSETDDQEKGLIDISFHRVLPADNERLTGLHATLTGATNSPTSPINAQGTIASAAADAEPESSLSKGGGDSMFIFKLMPPKAGLSKAVNFTKPTVHYFAVPNIKQGRLWMAALMKATIDRDDSVPVTTTYQQKTISLAKARQMRHRPPALMNLDEKAEEETLKTPASDKHGLNIQGIIFEGDSGVSGVSKRESANTGASQVPESAGLSNTYSPDIGVPEPQTA